MMAALRWLWGFWPIWWGAMAVASYAMGRRHGHAVALKVTGDMVEVFMEELARESGREAAGRVASNIVLQLQKKHSEL